MGKPITAMIYWENTLYGPGLQAFIDKRLTRDKDLVAPLRTVYNRTNPFGGGVDLIYDREGPHDLRHTDKGLRITYSQDMSVATIPGAEHGYKSSVWISDEPGLAWRVYLHSSFALVLPGLAAQRRSRKIMSEYTLFIMKKPCSAHERLSLRKTLESMQQDAADLLAYTWKDGITLRDPFKEVLSEPVFLKGRS